MTTELEPAATEQEPLNTEKEPLTNIVGYDKKQRARGIFFYDGG